MQFVKDEISWLFTVITVNWRFLEEKKGLMMAYVKPKLVAKNLFSKVVFDCLLRNL